MRYLKWVCLLSFIALLNQDLFAQERGRITGTVVGEAGNPLSGATVTMVGTRRATITDARGAYSLEVSPGTYSVTVNFIGYAPGTARVTVRAGEEVTQDFTLRVDPLALQGLVVTGTRVERRQQEATLSMAVISSERIEQIQPQSVAEVLRTIPGIHAEEGGGEVAVNSFIRGLPAPGQFRYQTLQEDGIPVRSVAGGFISAEDVFFRQDLNVQTLEVAKGGASTLFGITAPGGIINYRSKTGGEIMRSTLRFTAGEKDVLRLDFNTNGPLGGDYRFNLGGFYRFDRGPRISGLPTQGLQLKGNITRLLERGHLRLHFKYIDDRVQFFLPFAHNSQTLEPAIDSDGTHNSAAAADFSVPTPVGRFESTMERGVLTKGPSVMFEYYSEFGDGWSLENKTRWMDMEHEFNIFIPFVAAFPGAFAERFMTDPETDTAIFSFPSAPGAPFNAVAVMPQGVWGRFRPTEDLANQFVLQKRLDAGTSQHVFSLGTYLSRTEVTDKQIRPTMLFELADQPRAVDLLIVSADGDTTRVTRNGILEAANNFFNREIAANTLAVFGGDEITISDRFRIDLGARFERQTATVRVENTERFNLGPTLAEQNVVFGNGTFLRRDVGFEDFGVSLGVNVAVTDFLNVYGTGSRGFAFPVLGTFAGDVRLDAQGNFVQPEPEENEEFLQAEVGLKLSAPQFSGTLGGYWVQINDRLQTDIKIIGGQSLQVTDAVGESRTFGLEATGAFAPIAVPGLRVESSLTLQDHEATEFVIGAQDFSGNEIKRIPNFMLNSSLFYAGYGFDFMFNWSHLGSRFADDANLFELDEFDVFTANAGYTIPLAGGQGLRLGVNVYNLSDSEGLTEGDPRLAAGVDPTQFPFLNARPVLPHRIKASATYTF